jgi:hypothetical protein
MERYRTWDTPNIAAIIVVVVIVVVKNVVALLVVAHQHKLLLNLETLKFSTDTRPLIAAVLQCLVHVEILVYLVEILVDLVLDGVKWRKIYAVPIGYRVDLTREVPVLNPRREKNCIIREINTVFFPRDAPRLNI